MEYRNWYFKIVYVSKDGKRKLFSGSIPYKQGDVKLSIAKFAKVLFKEKKLGTFVEFEYIELR